MQPQLKNFNAFHTTHRAKMKDWFLDIINTGIWASYHLGIMNTVPTDDQDSFAVKLVYSVLPGIIATCLPISVGLLLSLQFSQIQNKADLDKVNQVIQIRTEQNEKIAAQLYTVSESLSKIEARLSVVENKTK